MICGNALKCIFADFSPFFYLKFSIRYISGGISLGFYHHPFDSPRRQQREKNIKAASRAGWLLLDGGNPIRFDRQELAAPIINAPVARWQ